MWIVIVCFTCYSFVNVETISSSSCQAAPENGSVNGESSTKTPPQGSCFVSSPSSGIPAALPQNQLNPRYTRAILAANRVPQNPNKEKIGIPSEINQEGDNRDPKYSRVMQHSPQNTFPPQGNVDYYRSSGHELREESGSPPKQVYSRPLYPTYDDSFPPPISPQGQHPTMNFNQGIPPTHAFGARSCPYCNSHLPPEPVYQRQMLTPRSSQFQLNPQFITNPFNKQYPMHQGQVGYQNVNPIEKTTPTIATEEMCPYDNGTPPEVPPTSSRTGYNQTLQVPDISGLPGDKQYPPSVNNPSPYLVTKNIQTFPQGLVTPKNMKTGIPSQQTFKYMKMQRTEGVMKNMDSNSNM